MDATRTIKVQQDIMQANDTRADAFRSKLRAQGTFFMDIMASPGAGKTTLLIEIIKRLRNCAKLGIIEADLESFVDSDKIKAVGVPAVQLQTNGICHVDMGMVNRAYAAFNDEHYDYLFLENIGNLICPADFDTGAHRRIMLLSVPEGFDKVYKYPPMFAIVDALVVTKTDYLPMNPDFDMTKLYEQACSLNPGLQFFETCAPTQTGIDELVSWIISQHDIELEGTEVLSAA